MPLHVRPARDADAALLPDIERAAGALFRTIPDLAWIADDHVMSAQDHRDAMARGMTWVAEDGAAPIGFVVTERSDAALHVLELAVHGAAQGRGAGRRLMDTAIAHARETGCAAVTLTTFRDVAWNEGFYARLGFRTLTGDGVDARLAALLAREVANGLPGDRRCAMRLDL